MLQAGDPASAERLAREGLRDGEDAKLLLLLAMALQMQGRSGEAVEGFERLVELRPEEVSTWGNYATTLRSLGRLDEARNAYRRALEIKPDNAAQWFNLGSLQLQEGDALGARESLLKAHALQPEQPLFRIVAARALCECRDYRAPDLIAPWQQWLPLPEDLQYDLADVMQLTDWTRESIDVLEDLTARSPQHTRAWLLLAALYERTNRLEEATSLVDRLAKDTIGSDEATRREVASQRANLLLRRGAIAEARELLEQIGPRQASDPTHYFQLGRACDRLGDRDAAMQAFAVAHGMQVEQLRRSAPQRFVPGTTLLPAAEFTVSREEFARWPDLRAPSVAETPVFVVGFPRSGTTLVEQMLDAHPDLQAMDERPFFYMLSEQLADQGFRVPQDLGKLGQRDCDELRRGYLMLGCSKIQRQWGTRLVDKNPLNMLWLPMIHRMFPLARFVFVQRHPCDALLSCYMQEFRSAVLAVMSATLEQAARGYVMAFQHWAHHVEVFRPSILTVRYEDLVAAPEIETRRIGEFLELADAAPLMDFDVHAREKDFIGTPSYTQVIEPIHRHQVARWTHYRPYFKSALPILEPLLGQLGYATDSGATVP